MHLVYERCKRVVKILNRGEFFGEIAFFSNRARTAGAKSYNFSSVFQLKREDFLTVVQEFPTDKVIDIAEINCLITMKFNRKLFIIFKTKSTSKRITVIWALSALLANRSGISRKSAHQSNFSSQKVTKSWQLRSLLKRKSRLIVCISENI